MGQKPSTAALRDHTVKDEIQKYSQMSRENVLRSHLTSQGPHNSHIMLTDAMERVIKSQLACPIDSDEDQDMPASMPRLFPKEEKKSVIPEHTGTDKKDIPVAPVNNSGGCNGDVTPKKFIGPKKKFLQEYLNETKCELEDAKPPACNTNSAVEQTQHLKTEGTVRPTSGQLVDGGSEVIEEMIKHHLMDPGHGQSQDDFMKKHIRNELGKTGAQDHSIILQYAENHEAEPTSYKRSRNLAAMLSMNIPSEDVQKHISNTIRKAVYNHADDRDPLEGSGSLQTSPNLKTRTVREHIQEAIKTEINLEHAAAMEQKRSMQDEYNSQLEETTTSMKERKSVGPEGRKSRLEQLLMGSHPLPAGSHPQASGAVRTASNSHQLNGPAPGYQVFVSSQQGPRTNAGGSISKGLPRSALEKDRPTEPVMLSTGQHPSYHLSGHQAPGLPPHTSHPSMLHPHYRQLSDQVYQQQLGAGYPPMSREDNHASPGLTPLNRQRSPDWSSTGKPPPLNPGCPDDRLDRDRNNVILTEAFKLQRSMNPGVKTEGGAEIPLDLTTKHQARLSSPRGHHSLQAGHHSMQAGHHSIHAGHHSIHAGRVQTPGSDPMSPQKTAHLPPGSGMPDGAGIAGGAQLNLIPSPQDVEGWLQLYKTAAFVRPEMLSKFFNPGYPPVSLEKHMAPGNTWNSLPPGIVMPRHLVHGPLLSDLAQHQSTAMLHSPNMPPSVRPSLQEQHATPRSSSHAQSSKEPGRNHYSSPNKDRHETAASSDEPALLLECTICHQIYTNVQHFSQHFQENHGSVKDVLENHIKIHNAGEILQHAQEMDSKSKQMIKDRTLTPAQKKQGVDDLYRCPPQGMSPRSTGSSRSPAQRSSSPGLHCPYCQEPFATSETQKLTEHMESHARIGAEHMPSHSRVSAEHKTSHRRVGATQHVDSRAGATQHVDSRAGATQHADSKLQPYCVVCRLLFPSPKEWEGHMQQLHQGRTCSCVVCASTFSSLDSFYHHIQAEHQGFQSVVVKFLCLYCGKPFDSQVDIQQHVQAHPKEVNHNLMIGGIVSHKREDRKVEVSHTEKIRRVTPDTTCEEDTQPQNQALSSTSDQVTAATLFDLIQLCIEREHKRVDSLDLKGSKGLPAGAKVNLATQSGNSSETVTARLTSDGVQDDKCSLKVPESLINQLKQDGNQQIDLRSILTEEKLRQLSPEQLHALYENGELVSHLMRTLPFTFTTSSTMHNYIESLITSEYCQKDDKKLNRFNPKRRASPSLSPNRMQDFHEVACDSPASDKMQSVRAEADGVHVKRPASADASTSQTPCKQIKREYSPPPMKLQVKSEEQESSKMMNNGSHSPSLAIKKEESVTASKNSSRPGSRNSNISVSADKPETSNLSPASIEKSEMPVLEKQEPTTDCRLVHSDSYEEEGNLVIALEEQEEEANVTD